MKTDEYYMQLAIKEALKAIDYDEVPIGAIIVKDDKIIAKAHNFRENKNEAIAHAELLAITKANKKLKSWRLEDCTLYVTLEPCIMCSGGIIQSRIKKVVYGAKDPKGGACGSSIDVMKAENINHHPEVVGGVLENECSMLLKNYFKAKRITKKSE